MMTFNIKGLKEVQENLRSLSKVSGERVMRSTMFYSSQPLLQRAQANVSALPRGSGALHKAIRRVWTRGGKLFGEGGRRFVVAIAPKTRDRVAVALANLFYKRKKPMRGVFWGHLVEWGFTHRGGVKVPGRGVFRRAAEAGASETIDRFKSRIWRATERALKKQDAAQ